MADAGRDGTVPDAEATIDAAPAREPEPARAIERDPARDVPELLAVERHHYAIAGELAKGGVGRILEARDLRLGRQVAIKELLPKNRDLARRFEREARITARLQHPAIIQVYEAGVWPGGEPFYAMPMVSGVSLDKVVAERATLVERLALVPNVIAVAEALAYAHSERVIHRDLKPANVLVGAFGQTVVIDWGLAKQLDEPSPEGKESMRMRASSDETTPGGIVGTPAYMAPEQARGAALDQRVDVYAIGALLYKVLAGVAPYTGGSAEVLEQVKAGPPVPIDEREPGTPPELAAIIATAMARAPADRYATAGELARDLERFQTGQLVAAHRYTTRQLLWRFVRRYRLPLAVGAIALAALAIGGTLSVRRILGEKRQTEAKRLALLEERGRTELLADHPGAALVYLVNAARDGTPSPALAFLLAEAMRPFEAELWKLDAGRGEVALAVSADGTRVATGTDHLVTWDLPRPTGASVAAHTLGAGHARIRVLAFDPQGTHVAAGDDDGTARVWDLARGGPPVVLRGHRGAIRDLELARDGRAVTAGDDGTARVWDVATGKLVATARCEIGAVLAARLSPDGSRLAAAGEDGDACVWSVDDDLLLAALRGGHTGPVRSVRWSRDGQRLLTASDDGTALLWNPELGKPVARPFVHGKAIVAAELSPDGDQVLTASEDHTAIVWEVPDPGDGTLPVPVARVRLVGHADPIVAATFDATGARVATADLDGVAKVWDAATGQAIASFEHANGVRAIAFAGPDRLVTADLAGRAHVWDISHRFAREPANLESQVHALAAGADWVAAGRDDTRVSLWHAGRALPPLTDHDASVLAVAFGDAGRTLVTGGDDAEALVWDTSGARATRRCVLAAHGGEPTVALAGGAGVIARALPDAVELWSTDCRLLGARAAGPGLDAVALRGDGTVAAVGDAHGRVGLWHSVYGVWLPARGAWSLAVLPGPVTALAFSPDGKRLLVAGDGAAVILETDRLADAIAAARRRGPPPEIQALEASTLDGPFGKVTAVAWLDADGARVVTANREGVARLWDARKGKLLAERGVHGTAANALAVSGRTLWLGGDDGFVRAWDVEPSHASPAEREALAARTGWKLRDDDVAVRCTPGKDC